ncbi:transmembrane 7 superfamily member 3-like [Tribolium madens]|uniref:transmembrane 7 superfamily member 3-like n=1 Tax=Tribolium madens TaxID=41895 RepID=UPI001CF74B15|nr:transmembrane 7 superfamily member 3-like [Tribolium madens]
MRLFFVFVVYFTVSEGRVITFDLSNYEPQNVTTQVQKVHVNLTRVSQIRVINIPESVGFFIIQVHSFLDNVTLSSSPKFKSKTTIKGPNVGLVSFNLSDTIFYVRNKIETRALIVVTIYQTGDPIPGGCNLSFPTEYAPYQLVSNTDEVIVVQSQPPSIIDSTCDKNKLQVDMYHLYLHENNYDPLYYFNGIEKMLTVNLIQKNGHKVSTVDGYFKYRKLYSAYRGVGQVFAIVATNGNVSSAYVPAVSYSCDLTQMDTCNGPVTPHWKLICAIMTIFGIFVCFFGHRFFRLTLYLAGFTLGIFVTYVILSLSSNNLTVEEKTTASILVGMIYGAVWLLVWWKFGIPIFSAGLTFFMEAFLMASIIFYSGVADLWIFHNNANFWLTFASIVVTFVTVWTMWTLEGHIFGCSFLGAYSCVAAMNYYVGGNLQYIIINSFRRMAVKNFNMATVDPPFQILDISQSILLVVMTTYGFYYQMKEQRGKPPFPPHRYTRIEEGVSERTPLVGNSGVIYSDI